MDRAPFTVWYHFGNQHAPAERTAQVHLEFFDHYDLDLLKLMNDYDYPMPAGLEVVATAQDLARLQPFDPTKTPFGTQLQTVELVARALRDRALFVDTVFNAWNTLKRNLVREAMPGLMAEQPQALEAALRIVNDNLIRYAQASLERGAAGIFLSVPATAESVTAEQYERFMRPFDLAFLEAIRGRGECHVLHAHGERLYFDRLVDYPVHALSWADLNGGPSIAEARRRTPLHAHDRPRSRAVRRELRPAGPRRRPRRAGGRRRDPLHPGPRLLAADLRLPSADPGGPRGVGEEPVATRKLPVRPGRNPADKG